MIRLFSFLQDLLLLLSFLSLSRPLVLPLTVSPCLPSSPNKVSVGVIGLESALTNRAGCCTAPALFWMIQPLSAVGGVRPCHIYKTLLASHFPFPSNTHVPTQSGVLMLSEILVPAKD